MFLHLAVFKNYNIHFHIDLLHMSRSYDCHAKRMLIFNNPLFEEFMIIPTVTLEMFQLLGKSHTFMATYFKCLDLTVPCRAVAPRLQRILVQLLKNSTQRISQF